MIIKIDDNTAYTVRRKLNPNTTEDEARNIHSHMNVDTLLRGPDGAWYLCDRIIDVEYRDLVNEVSMDFDERGLS